MRALTGEALEDFVREGLAETIPDCFAAPALMRARRQAQRQMYSRVQRVAAVRKNWKVPKKQRPPLLDKKPYQCVVSAVCDAYDVSEIDLVSDRSDKRLARVRHLAFYLLVKRGWHPKDVGLAFCKDRATVIYGVKVYKERETPEERELRQEIEEIVEQSDGGEE